jgi:hypothetical protein
MMAIRLARPRPYIDRKADYQPTPAGCRVATSSRSKRLVVAMASNKAARPFIEGRITAIEIIADPATPADLELAVLL